MSTHKAIATVAIRAPLAIIEVPTIQPVDREVRFRVEWTASTPLSLHQNDGGLLVKHPQILGGNSAGTVVEVGPAVRNLAVGDKVSRIRYQKPSLFVIELTFEKVFGFAFAEQKHKAEQEYVTVAETSLSKVSRKPARESNR